MGNGWALRGVWMEASWMGRVAMPSFLAFTTLLG